MLRLFSAKRHHNIVLVRSHQCHCTVPSTTTIEPSLLGIRRLDDSEIGTAEYLVMLLLPSVDRAGTILLFDNWLVLHSGSFDL